jgi:hypothetical protein
LIATRKPVYGVEERIAAVLVLELDIGDSTVPGPAADASNRTAVTAT